MFKLIIGNKNSSSWSLRPWLALKMIAEPFEEHTIPLGQAETRASILAINPAGKLPLLIDHTLKVWDSLAICEYLADCFPHARLWPEEARARAVARSMAAEMHAGFTALRQQLPMDVAHRRDVAHDESAAADIARIVSLWQEHLNRNQAQGPFLFGHFTIADAFYAPVVTRFVTYGTTLPPLAQRYADHMLSLPAMQEWYAAAEIEVGNE
ncbi:glutathione S-transferase family protein [Paludibacterium yongneupense]|uniref:glutathione S-transferase family protein n=1 Tax=Paludibacterium yongneupense TaxID=400061 RepID=UPI000404856F|nr:glutathione S-transferase family protein [Paludibacterium yongneupense]